MVSTLKMQRNAVLSCKNVMRQTGLTEYGCCLHHRENLGLFKYSQTRLYKTITVIMNSRL